jgi:topoisomerase-4 subunit A
MTQGIADVSITMMDCVADVFACAKNSVGQNTLVITQIPFSTNTTTLIDSILVKR